MAFPGKPFRRRHDHVILLVDHVIPSAFDTASGLERKERQPCSGLTAITTRLPRGRWPVGRRQLVCQSRCVRRPGSFSQITEPGGFICPDLWCQNASPSTLPAFSKTSLTCSSTRPVTFRDAKSGTRNLAGLISSAGYKRFRGPTKDKHHDAGTIPAALCSPGQCGIGFVNRTANRWAAFRCPARSCLSSALPSPSARERRL